MWHGSIPLTRSGKGPASGCQAWWKAGPVLAADLAVPADRDELIAYGPLLSDNGAAWLGAAVLLRAPDPDTARAILTQGRYADVEVHDWRFGGRPS